MATTLNVRRDKKPEPFKYTTSDDKLWIIKRKMFIFKKTWDVVKEDKKEHRKVSFWDAYNKCVKFTDYADDVLAQSLLDNVYLNTERVKTLQSIEDALWSLQYTNREPKSEVKKENGGHSGGNDIDKTNLLVFGSETSYEKAFIRHIDVNESIRSDDYVNRIMNDTRMCLFLIGREYEWRHGGKQVSVQLAGDIHTTLGDASNPITNSLKANVKAHLASLGRAGRLTVTFENKPKVKKEKTNGSEGGVGGESDEDSEDEDVRQIALRKNCLPVNLAITHHLIMELMAEFLDVTSRLDDTRRVVNLGNVLLVTTFCMHEGCRPIEIVKTEKHRDLTFWLNGVQYPILVLAFVKPETFNFLMESGELMRWCGDFWKAKRLKKYRMRVKSWMPLAYNSLDLPTIYIIVMRVLACRDLDNITMRIVNTDDQRKLTSILRRVVTKMGVQGLAWYSIRAGAAEDDKMLGLPAEWTRYRMGHTKTSLMPNRYANNLNQRVIVHDHQSLLGCDVSVDGSSVGVTDNGALPVFFKKDEGTIVKNGENLPTEIMEELNKVKLALQPLLSGAKDNGLRQCVEAGELYVASDRDSLMKDLKTITLGGEFVFMDKVIPSDRMYRTNIEATYYKVHGFFKKYEGPSVGKLLLWSFPQVMFGEFNSKLHDDAKRNSDAAFKQQQACIEVYKAAAIQLGIQPDKFSRKLLLCDTVPEMEKKRQAKEALETHEVTQKAPKAKKARLVGSVRNITRNKPKWSFKKLEVNDVIALKADVIGSNFISMPGTVVGFKLLYISSVDPKSKNREVQGHYYKGGVYGLVIDKRQEVSVSSIKDDDILWVWSLDEDEKPEDFKMAVEDIADVKMMLD